VEKRVAPINIEHNYKSQEQLSVLSRSARSGVFRIYCDNKGNAQINHPDNWLVVNPKVIGEPEDSKIDIATIISLFCDRDFGVCYQELNTALINGQTYVEKTVHLPSTESGDLWLKIHIQACQWVGTNVHLDGEIRNITDEIKAAQDLEKVGIQINTILLEVPMAMFCLKMDKSSGDVRPSVDPSNSWMMNCDALFGLPSGSIISPRETTQYIHPDDRQRIEDAFVSIFEKRLSRYHMEFRTIWPNGNEQWLSSKIVASYNDDHTPVSVSGVIQLITEQKLQQQHIEFMAGHDTLTDLPNRTLCMETLARTAAAADRYKRKFAVMYVDLDRFKMINDSLGHDAGDELLQEISRRFKSNLRASEFIARLGGDEFVVIVDGITHLEQAQTVADKLISLAIMPFTLQGHECRVTASVGVAVYPEHGTDEHTLLKHADMAMYAAKEKGKNNYQLYCNEMAALSMEQLDLEAQLRGALERNEFTLLYQPKVALQKNTVTGVEALIRWENAKLGFVSPIRFIPIAEENGLIVPIGKWVLETACRQAKKWQKLGLDVVPIAVNVSPRQFLEPDFYQHVVQALETTELSPSLLELELTEGMIMRDIDRTVELLTALKNLGVRVAIDDFGTGYSSLAQIRRFPIDTLKVDRSFVRNIHHDAEGQAIASAIFNMAKHLSLTVVAEGVETDDEASYLRSSSCDEMQGYYFSRPIDGDKLAVLLTNYLPRFQ